MLFYFPSFSAVTVKLKAVGSKQNKQKKKNKTENVEQIIVSGQ